MGCSIAAPVKGARQKVRNGAIKRRSTRFTDPCCQRGVHGRLVARLGRRPVPMPSPGRALEPADDACGGEDQREARKIEQGDQRSPPRPSMSAIVPSNRASITLARKQASDCRPIRMRRCPAPRSSRSRQGSIRLSTKIGQRQEVQHAQDMQVHLLAGGNDEIADRLRERPMLQDAPGKRHRDQDEEPGCHHQSPVAEPGHRQPFHGDEEADEEDELPGEGIENQLAPVHGLPERLSPVAQAPA